MQQEMNKFYNVSISKACTLVMNVSWPHLCAHDAARDEQVLQRIHKQGVYACHERFMTTSVRRWCSKRLPAFSRRWLCPSSMDTTTTKPSRQISIFSIHSKSLNISSCTVSSYVESHDESLSHDMNESRVAWSGIIASKTDVRWVQRRRNRQDKVHILDPYVMIDA